MAKKFFGICSMKAVYHLTYTTQGFLGSHWSTDLPALAAMADALAGTRDVERVVIASVTPGDDTMVERVKR